MTDKYSNTSAEQLFMLVREKNNTFAFEELYNRYWYKLFLIAYKRLPVREDAEGAVQNLFESLWKNRTKISIHSSLENYLFASIRYIILRIIYKKKQAAVIPIEEKQESLFSYSDLEEMVVVDDLTLHIHKTVSSLPKKCKRVFEMSRYEMKTHKEIAAIMGISEKTVENHISKAIRLIKSNLNYFFFL